MPGTNLAKVALITACLAGGLLSGAQNPTAGLLDKQQDDTSLLGFAEDTKESWILTFSALVDKGVSAANGYLIHALPQMLATEMGKYTTHFYNQGEKLAYSRILADRQKLGWQRELEQIKSQEDAASIRSQSNPASADSQARKRDLITAIQWSEEQDPADLPIVDEKPIHIVDGGAASLFPPLGFSVEEFARINGADHVFWGEIDEIQDVVVLQIRLYSALLRRNVAVYEDAGSPEALFAAIPDMVRIFAGPVLGKAWSSLTIIPEPKESAVYLDGKLKGIGKIHEPSGAPGKLQIRVTHPGYQEKTLEIFTGLFEEKEVRISLIQEATTSISITSSPPDADVYLDSRWVGTTPLAIDSVFRNQKMLLKKEGYEELPYWIEDDPPPVLRLSLDRQIMDRNLWQNKRRDAFYAALGAFAISVPFPLFLQNAAWDAAYAQRRALPGSREYEQFSRQTEVFYYSYGATLFVSVSLFANAIGRLIDYIAYIDRILQ